LCFGLGEVADIINNITGGTSEPEPQINIFSGDDRPIAIIFDNNTAAQPHSGLEKAYIVYEILVEAGETRLLGLFKGQDMEMIGPTRSARHYFVDYAIEHDAIFVHHGGSPQAYARISDYGVDAIDGMHFDGTNPGFWRQPGKRAPHNSYMSSDMLNRILENRNVRTTSNEPSILNYVAHEVLLEDGEVADVVTIPYAPGHVVRYEFDEVSRRYVRYSKNRRQMIGNTGEPLTVKNIIILRISNTHLNDGSGTGRQELHNIGEFEGYYITNGRWVRITAEKTDRRSPTVFRDLEGNLLEVNDGNTFIQIVPPNANIEMH